MSATGRIAALQATPPRMRTDSDASLFLNRLGVEARYQKNLEIYLLFEHHQFVDGNLIDDRANSTNPGGTDVFGRAAGAENPGFHTERYYIRYKFPGTPAEAARRGRPVERGPGRDRGR